MGATLLRALLASSLMLMIATSGPAADIYGLGALAGGSSSGAVDVSADGSVVVGGGDSANGEEAFRWTQTEGMVGLGDLVGGTVSSVAHSVSADGSVVVGVSDSANGGEAFRWTQTGGMVGLGDLTGVGSYSVANGVSADGSVVVGYSHSANGSEAFRWTQAEGMVGLGDLDGGFVYSFAADVSADGSVVVGFGTTSSPEAFRWTEAGGMVGLGDLVGGTVSSDARGVSADGSTVVGRSDSANGDEAFRWTQTGGMVGLGHLTGVGSYSVANGVSADGSVVVGYSDSANGDEAFRWTQADGMQSVTQLLTDDGIDMTGWYLISAEAVSDNGTVIVGYGSSPESGPTGVESWLARIGSGIITPNMINPSMTSVQKVPESAHGLVRESLENSLLAARHYRGRPDTQFNLYTSGFGGEWHSYSAGASIGLAYDVNNSIRLGSSLFRSGYRADEALSTNIEIDALGGTLWVGYQAPGSGLQLHLVGLLADLDTDIERGYQNGSGLDRSQGSPNGRLRGVMAQIGWRVPVRELAALTPYAAYSWTKVDLDGYTETGGGFPARFDRRIDRAEVVRLGVEAEMQASEATSLWLKAAYGDRLDDNATGISGDIVGLVDFNLPGYRLDDNWIEGDLGMNWQATETISVFFSYGGAFDSEENPQWRTSLGLVWALM